MYAVGPVVRSAPGQGRRLPPRCELVAGWLLTASCDFNQHDMIACGPVKLLALLYFAAVLDR